jgi:RNA polymerase sigma factor (sigma-70 family)
MRTMADDADFDELFRREYPRLRRLAHSIVGDGEVAREVAQEAMTRLYADWRRLSKLERPGAWARRVAIREAVRVRERATVPAGTAARLSVEWVSGSGDAGAAQAAAAVALDVRRALSTLSPMQRAAVALYYLEDLPVEEIADDLDCDASTVRVHLSRGRRNLAAALGEELTNDD